MKNFISEFYDEQKQTIFLCWSFLLVRGFPGRGERGIKWSLFIFPKNCNAFDHSAIVPHSVSDVSFSNLTVGLVAESSNVGLRWW